MTHTCRRASGSRVARDGRTVTLVLSCLMTLAACVRQTALPAPEAPPAMLLGTFTDDYDGTYRITASTWQHGSRSVYEIAAWHADSQYAIARNADANPSAGGRWTRIDWMRLDGMAPYTWAYCLSAHDAPTREAAEAVRIAKRETPRTGCNGFPFSRMRPAP